MQRYKHPFQCHRACESSDKSVHEQQYKTLSLRYLLSLPSVHYHSQFYSFLAFFSELDAIASFHCILLFDSCSCIFCSCFLHTSKIKPATFSLQLRNVLRTYTYTFYLRLPLPIKHIIITVYINLQSSLFSWNWTPSLLRIIILPSFCSCFFNIFSYSF